MASDEGGHELEGQSVVSGRGQRGPGGPPNNAGRRRLWRPAAALIGAALAVVVLFPVVPVGATPSRPPGTSLGGLNLDGYCQSNGYTRSEVNGPIVGPSAAYHWNCVRPSGALVAINMQAACNYQYPHQGGVAFAQDPGDAYSWICVIPYQGVTAGAGGSNTVGAPGALISFGPGGTQVAFDGAGSGSSGVVQLGPGSGTFAFDGAGGTNAGLSFEGAGGGSSGLTLTFEGAGGTSSGLTLTFDGAGGTTSGLSFDGAGSGNAG